MSNHRSHAVGSKEVPKKKNSEQMPLSPVTEGAKALLKTNSKVLKNKLESRSVIPNASCARYPGMQWVLPQ